MNILNSLNSKQITQCQVCGSNELESIVFLGFVPPVNEMLGVGSIPDVEMRFPLELLRCKKCTLVQIGYEVDPRILFPHSYPYLSGTTRILRENFNDLAVDIEKFYKIPKNELIIDVGANDGTLLRPFLNNGYKVLGIEPSQAADVAIKNNIPMEKEYFSVETAEKIANKYGQAKVVTAANVFAHIRDVHSVVNGIKRILSQDGIFVSESHYLLDLVDTLQYDTVYHEHLRYYSLESLINLFRQHDLEVIRVKRIPTHGGSIRVYTARKERYDIDFSVGMQLEAEKQFGLSDGSAFSFFKKRVVNSRHLLLKMLCEIKANNKRIYAVGAPSRSSTLVNYVGLDESFIDCVVEVDTSHKLNKYIPGTRVPVVDEAKLFLDQPEYAFLFSWHITKELVENLRNKGFKGKFIIPLPEPEII